MTSLFTQDINGGSGKGKPMFNIPFNGTMIIDSTYLCFRLCSSASILSNQPICLGEGQPLSLQQVLKMTFFCLHNKTMPTKLSCWFFPFLKTKIRLEGIFLFFVSPIKTTLFFVFYFNLNYWTIWSIFLAPPKKNKIKIKSELYKINIKKLDLAFKGGMCPLSLAQSM